MRWSDYWQQATGSDFFAIANKISTNTGRSLPDRPVFYLDRTKTHPVQTGLMIFSKKVLIFYEIYGM